MEWKRNDSFGQATESTIKWDGQILILTILSEKEDRCDNGGHWKCVRVLTRGKRRTKRETSISSENIVNDNI